MSGQHIKEFRDFLLKYSDEFVVNEDTIYLREYEGTVTQLFKEKESHPDKVKVEEDNSIGSEELVQVIKERLKEVGTKNMEILLQDIKSAFPENELPFKTESDFRWK